MAPEPCPWCDASGECFLPTGKEVCVACGAYASERILGFYTCAEHRRGLIDAVRRAVLDTAEIKLGAAFC